MNENDSALKLRDATIDTLQAEIKRLKRELRQAREGATLSGWSEAFYDDGDPSAFSVAKVIPNANNRTTRQ